jgi:hypothetical protein
MEDFEKSRELKLIPMNECIEPIMKTDEWRSLKETEQKLDDILNSNENYEVALIMSPMVDDIIVNIDRNTTMDIKGIVNKLLLPENKDLIKILLKNKEIPLDFTIRIQYSPKEEFWDEIRTLLELREEQKIAVEKMKHYLEIKQKKKVKKWIEENKINEKLHT